jgi:hypothetical protein
MKHQIRKMKIKVFEKIHTLRKLCETLNIDDSNSYFRHHLGWKRLDYNYRTLQIDLG